MSHTLVLVALCALSAVIVTARPQKRETPLRVVALADTGNRTMCPIKVWTNTAEGRIPRHIAMIQCDHAAIDECRPANHAEDNCCKHIGEKRRECYQIETNVPVMYEDGRNGTFKAQVGCACMIQDGIRAKEITF